MPSPQDAKFKPAWQIRHHLQAREPLQNATRIERHWVTHEQIQSLRTYCQYRRHKLCLPADSASRFCRGRQRQLRDPVRSGESRSHPMWPSMHGRGPWAMFRSTRLKPGSWFSQAFRSADLFAEHESKTIIMAIIHGSDACLSACLLPAAEHVSPGLPVRQCKRLVMATAAQPSGVREFIWRKRGLATPNLDPFRPMGAQDTSGSPRTIWSCEKKVRGRSLIGRSSG